MVCPKSDIKMATKVYRCLTKKVSPLPINRYFLISQSYLVRYSKGHSAIFSND